MHGEAAPGTTVKPECPLQGPGSSFYSRKCSHCALKGSAVFGCLLLLASPISRHMKSSRATRRGKVGMCGSPVAGHLLHVWSLPGLSVGARTTPQVGSCPGACHGDKDPSAAPWGQVWGPWHWRLLLSFPLPRLLSAHFWKIRFCMLNGDV